MLEKREPEQREESDFPRKFVGLGKKMVGVDFNSFAFSSMKKDLRWVRGNDAIDNVEGGEDLREGEQNVELT